MNHDPERFEETFGRSRGRNDDSIWIMKWGFCFCVGLVAVIGLFKLMGWA